MRDMPHRGQVDGLAVGAARRGQLGHQPVQRLHEGRDDALQQLVAAAGIEFAQALDGLGVELGGLRGGGLGRG